MDDRILRNVEKLINAGASAPKIDQYLREEGVSKAEVKAAFAKRKSVAETGIDTDSSFLGALGQGASFGFSDEILAGGRALMGQDYDKALQAERDALQRYRTTNPVASGAGELGGGLGTALIPFVGQFGNAARGASMGTQMGKAAMGGAGFGALSGAGSAEGDLVDRLQGAAVGGTLGAGLGAATPAVMAGARAGGSKLLDVMGMRSANGLQGRADELLAQALARDGVAPEEIARRLAEAQAAGKPLGIIDVAGQNTLGLGRAASGVPSSSKETAYRNLMERAEGAPARISGDLQQAMGVPKDVSYMDMFEAVTQRLRTSAKPLYDKAYAAGAAVDDADVLKYLAPDSPLKSFLPRAWKEAQEQASLEGETLTNPFKRTIAGSGDEAIETLELAGPVSLKHLDYIKRALDDIIQEQRGNKQRLLRNVKNDFVDRLKERYPEYREALSRYRGDIEMREALEAGRNIMSEASDMTARQLAKLSDAEKRMFRIGATTAIRDAVNTARDRTDVVRRIFGSPEQRAKLKAVFPSESAYKQFERAMTMESRASGTKAAITSGSRTTPMAQEIADMGINPSLLADFAMNPASAIPRAAMSEALRNRLQGVHGAVAESLNDRLFNFNPAQQRGVLDAMQNTQQRMTQEQLARQAARQSVARGLGTIPGLFVE